MTANALCPGLVATDLGRYITDGVAWYERPFKRALLWFTMARAKTVEEGALTHIYLASSDEVEGESGGYFVDCAPADPSDLSRDDALAAAVWEASEALVDA